MATARPWPSPVLSQRLADDALQRAGELRADLLLLVRREDVDDAVDRLGRVLRVQGGEDQVAGLGGGEGHRDRLEVTHLADQDDVGVLPQHVLERVLRRTCVSSPTSRWLTMHFWCWCRNSIGSSTVMMCSLRVRFARSISEASVVDLPEPVGPVTRTKPRGSAAKFATDGGHAEVLELADLERDDAEGRAERVALPVDVDAEPGPARHAVREVQLEVLLELLPLLLGQGGVEHALDDRRGEDRLVLHLAAARR